MLVKTKKSEVTGTSNDEGVFVFETSNQREALVLLLIEEETTSEEAVILPENATATPERCSRTS